MTNTLAIVFDLDGTLIDSAPDIQVVANTVLGAEGVQGLSLAETTDFIGSGAGVFVTRMMSARDLGDDVKTHARLLADFEKHYKTATSHSKLYPGVIDALDNLKATGYRMGLCTNKPIAATNTVLAHFGLDKYFAAIAGGDTLPQRKPDPAPLLYVFDQLDASPENRLYVGDSEVDVKTAQNANVPIALFTEGYRKTPIAELLHAYSFSNFAKLPKIVDGHSS